MVLTLMTLLVSCDLTADLEQVTSSCDPLDPGLCALPFPSSFYLEPGDTPSGLQVSFKEDSLGIDRDGNRMDPTRWNERDGFPTMGPLLTYFDDLSEDGLIGHQDIGAYESANATTILLDLETGERIAHWAEIDIGAAYDNERLLILQPAVPLHHDRSYVVGIRGLKTHTGKPVTSSDAFLALRDGTTTDTWDVEGRRDHFDSVLFPALATAGFAQDELQLAWDFHTASRESVLGRLEWMRDDALERTADGPMYWIDQVDDSDCDAGADIARSVEGRFVMPLYTETDDPGTELTRDADGMPYYNGDIEVEFLLKVPCSVWQSDQPGPLIQYGHGLLGTREEIGYGWTRAMANELGVVTFATDWKGMSEDDYNSIIVMTATNLAKFPFVPERSHQGFVEFAVALRVILNQVAYDDALLKDGAPLIDVDTFGYYGNSQGGIYGGGYLAMSTDLTRGVLGVPGAPYGLLLPRSSDFSPYFLILVNKWADHRDILLNIALMSMIWEPTEAGGWLRSMNESPGPGAPAKQVLLQVAIGDAQVSSLGAQIMARAYGAKTIAPQTRSIWGVPESEPGFEGSGIVEWFYADGAVEPVGDIPPDPEYDTHECPRREWAAKQQMLDFLTDGVVNQYCDGICQGVREGFCD
jgi:hypothetical protein